MTWLPDKVLNHLQNVVDLPDLGGLPYRCVSRLGQGGMGSVFLAEDHRLKRTVALKILNQADDNGELAERMLQEAYIIAALEHPGIVPIHDVGTLPDGRVFYTMKLVKGARLDEIVAQLRSEAEVLRIFTKVCDAVAFAHAHHVIHRDLKPENVMVGDFGEVLVLDWGLSKVLAPEAETMTNSDSRRHAAELEQSRPTFGSLLASSHLTEHGTVMGTPHYMAPEQARGETAAIDRQTDVYSLGALLQFLVQSFLHQKPRTPSGLGKLLMSDGRSRPRKVPRHLSAIIRKATAEAPGARYASVSSLAQDVENFLDGEAVSAYRERFIEVAWRWLKRNRFLIFLILVYLLVRLMIIFLSQL